MNGDHTFSVPLKTPLPVLIVYGTGFAAGDGLVYFLPDIYGEDRALSRAIQKVSQKRADNDRTDIHASQ